MKLFISWSGPRSQYIASALKSWIKPVLQSVEPWMSSEDIAMGSRWSNRLSSELSTQRFGVLCMTPENLQSTWIAFEAGALSSALDESHVIPLLYELEPIDLTSPYSQFQSCRLNKDGIFSLLKTLNDISDSKMEKEHLAAVFEAMWPKLEESLNSIPELASGTEATAKRSLDSQVEEVLETVRAIQRDLSRSAQGSSSVNDQQDDSLKATIRDHLHSYMRARSVREQAERKVSGRALDESDDQEWRRFLNEMTVAERRLYELLLDTVSD